VLRKEANNEFEILERMPLGGGCRGIFRTTLKLLCPSYSCSLLFFIVVVDNSLILYYLLNSTELIINLVLHPTSPV